MKIIQSFLTFLIITGCSDYYSNQKIDFTSQWDTLRVLENPYKGWYHHLLDNGIDLYPIKNDSVFLISRNGSYLFEIGMELPGICGGQI
jgi:hypothetical protein